MKPKFEVNIDRQSDAAYIRLTEGDVDKTIQATESVLVDVDRFGVAVGLELLSLDTEVPYAELIRNFHVRSEVLTYLSLIRPTVRGFLSLTQGADGMASRTVCPGMATA